MTDVKKTVTVGELLRESTSEELSRRDGEWNAFTSAVFRQLDQEDLGHARASLEDQAIDLFKAGIEAELTASAPRFEEAFREEVEQRIFQSAKEPTLWQRLQDSMKALLRPSPMFTMAGAAALGVMLFAVVNRTPDPEVIAEALPGEVSVESIGFEGTVTVVPQQGVTVIWLSGA